MPALRNAYFVLAGLTLLLVVVQFVLAGLLIFQDRDSLDAHGMIGNVLHLPPLLMIIAAAVARMGREAILWAIGLLVLVIVQVGLGFGDSWLHPLGALIVFVVAHTIFQKARAWRLVTTPVTTAPTA